MHAYLTLWCVCRLAAGKGDGTVDVYDAKSPNLGLVKLHTFEAHTGKVTCLCLSPAGDMMATCSGREVKVGVRGALCC